MSAGASASSGCHPGAAAGLTVCSDHEGLVRTKGRVELHDRILFPANTVSPTLPAWCIKQPPTSPSGPLCCCLLPTFFYQKRCWNWCPLSLRSNCTSKIQGGPDSWGRIGTEVVATLSGKKSHKIHHRGGTFSKDTNMYHFGTIYTP